MTSEKEVTVNVEWMEETLSAVLVSAIPRLPADKHAAFAASAAKAVVSGYAAAMSLLTPAKPQD